MSQDMTSPCLQNCILEALNTGSGNNLQYAYCDTDTNHTSKLVLKLKVTDYCNDDSIDILDVCEVMTHPGNITGSIGGCGDMPDGFSKSSDRVHEMEVLSSDKMKEFYVKEKLTLISFNDIKVVNM